MEFDNYVFCKYKKWKYIQFYKNNKKTRGP